jgi:hypothetical protein
MLSEPMGIDLRQFSDKITSIYRPFHFHVLLGEVHTANGWGKIEGTMSVLKVRKRTAPHSTRLHLSNSQLRRETGVVLPLFTAQRPLVRPLFGWSQFVGINQDPVQMLALNPSHATGLQA